MAGAAAAPAPTCRICGCTDADCRQCFAKTGSPCAWIEPDLCSACLPAVELRAALDEAVQQGHCSRDEADEAFKFFDELSDAELRGEVGQREALQLIELFGFGQLDRRARN